jgi:hypothetical protein
MERRWRRNHALYLILPISLVLLLGWGLLAQPIDDPPLKVMKIGLGSGRVTSNTTSAGVLDIDCGSDCDQGYTSTVTVVLTATADPLTSTFAGWDTDSDGDTTTNIDCAEPATPVSVTCTVTMDVARSVRPKFDLLTPIQQIRVFDTVTGAPSTRTFTSTTRLARTERIRAEDVQAYLDANTNVDTVAEFIAALLPEFKQNWILMSRSESLQTGTAQSPRILLPSQDARFVFTVGMTDSSSYPGAHPDAIEFMEWDPDQKNFRFHEIVLNPIGNMGETITFPDGTTAPTFPARPRRVVADDAKCSKCHSTRNVLNIDRRVSPPVRGPLPGTDIIPPGTAIPPGTVMAKNKPNWDTYDSWGGMLPFNRDRIFQGSVEAAAFRKIFNPWTWRTNDAVRSIIEQLKLQPDGVPAVDSITRVKGGANDGHVKFAFDGGAIITSEPTPEGAPPPTPVSTRIPYSFDRVPGTPPGTDVTRGGASVLLHHTSAPGSSGPSAEGRGVRFFDFLGGAQGIDLDGDGSIDANLNALRIADELATHRIAPGSVPIDVRPVALAISLGCLNRSNAATVITGGLEFFNARHRGRSLTDTFNNTRTRSESVPRRKADIQRMNLDQMQFDGSLDPYVFSRPTPTPTPHGLLQQYGSATSLTTTGVARLRQEVFRRPPDPDLDFFPDAVIGGYYVDREDYSPPRPAFNTEKVALYRYFLEPLGVSVDKWSMGVRGRSRTYAFADVFDFPQYEIAIRNGLIASLTGDRFRIDATTELVAPFTCANPNLMRAVNTSFSGLAPDGSGAIPTYTDIQRIFNKSCIECHGGLLYPPYSSYVNLFNPAVFEVDEHLDLSEEEYPIRGTRRRMERSHQNAVARISTPPESSQIYRRITDTSEDCPGGLMPCGGPALSEADIHTVLRWLQGSPLIYSEGDPHIKTVDGVNYDFQSAGEFVLLRGENLEIQARQVAIDTGSPLGPNEHTDLSSCVSVNGAIAVRINGRRITYQPNLSGEPDPSGLQLRIDGKLHTLTASGIPLDSGVRITQTTAAHGIRIESPGGSSVVITPTWVDYWQLWFMNIDVERARATEGIMGAIASGSWLPALPDGTSLGSKPTDLHQRYVDLYEKFEAAWRVTDSTTLFDYAPATSTSNFTIESWPIENPQTCQVPRRTGPPPRPPRAALPLAAAEQACAGIVANDRRTNCIKDVMVTGETIFGKSYLLTDQIVRNTSPTVPVLGSPADHYQAGKIDLTLPITFTWGAATDSDGDIVNYRHCVWPLGQRPDNNKCEPTSVATTSRRRAVLWILMILLIICLLLLLFLIFVRHQKKPAFLILLAVAVVALVAVGLYIGRSGTTSGPLTKTGNGLEPGKEYFWKVIAEDGKGGIAESETRRFKTK